MEDEEGVCRLRRWAQEILQQVESLPSHILPPCPRARLLKLLRSELRFLHSCPPPSALRSTNLGYLHALVQTLHHPSVDSVSAVLQAFPVPPSQEDDGAVCAHVDVVCAFRAKPVWIVVSDRNPKYLNWLDDEGSRRKGWRSRTQLLVKAAVANSVLQPSAVLFCFTKPVSSSLVNGFETEFGASRIETFGVQDDHQQESDMCQEVGGEMFRELEDGEWVDIRLFRKHVYGGGSAEVRSTASACGITFQIDIVAPVNQSSQQLQTQRAHSTEERLLPLRDASSNDIENVEESGSRGECDCLISSVAREMVDVSLADCRYISGDVNAPFFSLLTSLKRHAIQLPEESSSMPTSNLVNLDTTALVAFVSEASNGAASMLVAMSNEDLVSRFGTTAQFMKDQAEAELESSFLPEMTNVLVGKGLFISESVCSEFKSLVSLCGGFLEKQRADALLNLLPVFPNMPSVRVMGLRETGKIKEKNKIVFGTGDNWQAPTLTANLSFVRAVRQTGMVLSVIEHEPRALVGDKCR